MAARARLSQSFDYAAFKAAWRARARALGVSTERGATSFGACLAGAALAQATPRKPIDWLRYVPLAKGEPMGGRDRFEDERFAAIEREARQRLRMIDTPRDLVPADMLTVREIWLECKRELLADLTVRPREVALVQLTIDDYLAELRRKAALTPA